jgi:catechol 2,3-dioxygenase-like lactoylglutathione lyase family enzyme
MTMPISTGFNHVATVTGDLDRTVRFYQAVFDAEVTFEIQARDDHPRMAILDLGGTSALNVFEQPGDTIVGVRNAAGGRGPIDHYGIAVASRADLDVIRDRLVAGGADIGTINKLEVCTPA